MVHDHNPGTGGSLINRHDIFSHPSASLSAWIFPFFSWWYNLLPSVVNKFRRPVINHSILNPFFDNLKTNSYNEVDCGHKLSKAGLQQVSADRVSPEFSIYRIIFSFKGRLTMAHKELPIPPHFDSNKVGDIWKVPYQQRAAEAASWAQKHHIQASVNDRSRICLVGVDIQNTFCIPEFELYVGGRSGTGAVDDNRRLCEFIYRNLDVITQNSPTMDTHQAMQIFHPLFFVNDQGEHPPPFTLISEEDLKKEVWKLNPALGAILNINEHYAKRYLLHYTRMLGKEGKYNLTIWPYHAMLGGVGHALVSAFEEAVFFHCIARNSQPNFQIKGDNPLTEHYSVLGPEVQKGPEGEDIAAKNTEFIEHLLQFDVVVIAGQAKSHCVAWTIDDLLKNIRKHDISLAEKVYLLEDCTSPVVISGVMDYTDRADEAFRRFADAGMHVVRSTEPIDSWPDLNAASGRKQ
jgi:nicotinamidase-related amidase